MTEDSCDQVRKQPTQYQIKVSALFFPGPVLSYRAFKQSASPKAVRSVTQTEYDSAVRQLCPIYGTIISARVARVPKPISVFVKKSPDTYEAWPSNSFITQDQYEEKYSRQCHSAITQNIKQLLTRQGLLNEEQPNE